MSTGAIKIVGMRDFTTALRKATEDKSGEQAVKVANVKTGEFVVAMAKREASTKMERRSASTLKATKAMAAVRVALGSEERPYYAGANFGAYRNKRRLIKAHATRVVGDKVISRRTRATMLRSGEKVEKVAARVERQYVDVRGRTMSKRLGVESERVRLARTKSGKIRVMRGWNQFRRWKKGEDYFLYKAIRKNYNEIVAFYFAALGDAVKTVFPDHG